MYCFFQAEDCIRGFHVTGVQTCALPILYPWRKWRGLGVELRMVGAPDAPLRPARGEAGRAERWNDALVAAIDARTMLVSIEQAHWTDGTLFDLARLVARCREVAALEALG